MHDDRLQQSLRELHSFCLGDATMGETLLRVSELLRSAVVSVEDVGLTLQIEGRTDTYVFTNPDIPEVDRAQYETGDGPCLEAFATGELVVLRSTKEGDRFPEFCEAAAEHGYLSVVAVPLEIPQGRIGAMNLYSGAEDAFGDAEITAASRFAEDAAFLLANAQAYWDARTLASNLERALESRAVIEQAKGMVMAATGCSDEEAFQKLRTQSQFENIKLRDVATEIVRGARRA